MRQPRIKIFGNVYKVRQVEFAEDGKISKIVYQVAQDIHRSVFRSSAVITPSLTGKRGIQEPTQHPFHDYAYAPDLERLLVTR